MKGLYYARIHSQDPVNFGAVKKCHGLMNGFRQLGHEMDMVWYGASGVLFNEEVIFRFPFSTDSSDFRNIFFHHLLFDDAIAQKVGFKEYGFMFIRYPLAHPGFIRFLRKAKSANPTLRIFLEVPTYPYQKEFSTPLRKMQYWLDQRCSRYLKKYVDWSVHYGEFESLFGIPSIALQNGVDVGAVPVSRSVPKHGLLRLIAVGNWNYWHGLDRLIEGLGNYYKAGKTGTRVELTVVGGGRSLVAWQQLTGRLNLGEVVRFLPPAHGQALDRLFDEADVAVGCLGMFRKNVLLDSSLKHREYAARGIPFVTSSTDPGFSFVENWVLQFPAEETAIQIEDICLFFEQMKFGDISHQIRQYAEDVLDWKNQLKRLPLV